MSNTYRGIPKNLAAQMEKEFAVLSPPKPSLAEQLAMEFHGRLEGRIREWLSPDRIRAALNSFEQQLGARFSLPEFADVFLPFGVSFDQVVPSATVKRLFNGKTPTCLDVAIQVLKDHGFQVEYVAETRLNQTPDHVTIRWKR